MFSIFSWVCWPCVCLLWRKVCLGLPPFFFDFFFFYIECMNMSCLCILEINPLSVVSYANIFPYSESFLLILFTISFAVRKLLSLVRSHFFKICFYFHWIKKHHMVIYVKDVLSLFSSKSFIVSAFTFRSLIHFEFIFVYGIWECAILILLHVAVQFSQHHLLKILFSTIYSYLLCHRLGGHRWLGLLLDFLFYPVPLIHISGFFFFFFLVGRGGSTILFWLL